MKYYRLFFFFLLTIDCSECRKSVGEKSSVKSVHISPKTRRHSFAPNTLTRNNKVTAKQEHEKEAEIEPRVEREEEYVRVPKSEYEAFKTRLHSIETKITQEFNTVKLNAIKAELGRNNGLEQVENKFHETVEKVEQIEDSERKTDQLAKRLSRELKIRPNPDNQIIRSPSARKIGSLRRRRDSSTRLSRNQSWHLGTSSNSTTTNNSLENKNNSKTVITSLSFYPKPNVKRVRLGDSLLVNQNVLPVIPQSTEKFVPEKPVRKAVNNSNCMNSETWTPATDFFNDQKNAPRHEDEKQKFSVVASDSDATIFKTPTRPNNKQHKYCVVANGIDLTNTPMLPPKLTPVRKNSTPMSNKKTPALNKTIQMTPNENREARASIIQIRNQNAGMVAQKAKLFDDLSADLTKSADRSIKIPRVLINKNLENVKNMSINFSTKNDNVPLKNQSPRRNSRSPGVNRRMQLRISSQSPVLKTIKENVEKREKKVNILKPEILSEIASPKDRKALSQNNTPRCHNKTPKFSSKKRTPRNNSSSTKSPRMRRHHISFD